MTENTSEKDKRTGTDDTRETGEKPARRRRSSGSKSSAKPAASADKAPRKTPARKGRTPRKRARTGSRPAGVGHGVPAEAHAAVVDALAQLPVGVAGFGPDFRLIFANDHFYKVFDISPEDLQPGLLLSDMMARVQELELFADGQDVEKTVQAVEMLAPGETRQNLLNLRSGRVIEQKLQKMADGSWVSVLTDRTARVRAEEQAHEAEYRWSFALESARQGVWDSNLVTGEVFYSHVWREIRGLESTSSADLTREFWLERLHPEDAERVVDYTRRQNEGEVFEDGITYRERHANGDWLWIFSRGRAVAWDAEGKPTRIIGTDTDITETRRTQEALAEAESRWNFALKGTGQGVWDSDIKAKKKYYSPTWRQMRGIEPEEEINGDREAWLERIHPEDRARLRDIVEKQDRGIVPVNQLEYRERHRDGHYIWIQSRGKTIAWDDDGKPIRTIGIDTDITTRKELELRAAESLRQLNTTLDNFPGGICLYDKDLVLTVANARYYRINHIDAEQFPVGSKLEDILRFHAEQGHYGPVDIDSFIAERLAIVRANEWSEFEITSDDGITIKYRTVPLEDGGFIMTFEDVTQSVKEAQDRERLEKELVQAQRLESLGTLASGIAHEINTPIQYVGDNLRFIARCLRDLLQILQFCRRAMHGPVDPGLIAERAEELENMERLLDLGFLLEELPLAIDQSAQGIQQITRIVKAVREFSHPGHEDKTEFDINAIIETTLIVSKNQWKYFAEVETDLDRSLPQIKCLPGEIGQVVLNLVVNAAHAIEAAERENGLIRITTRRKEDFVLIDVTDNGCGVPDEIKNRIYDPFFTTKDIGHGTGQGLSIAFNAVVNKHKGTIDCDSREGEGTTFTVALPIAGDINQETEAA